MNMIAVINNNNANNHDYININGNMDDNNIDDSNNRKEKC